MRAASPASRSPRRLWVTLQAHPWPALVLVALAFRVALTLPALGHVERFYVVPDSYEYDRLAVNLVQGHGFSQASSPPYLPDVRRTPVYPFMLAAIYAVVGHQPVAAVAANVLLGVLACVLTAALGSRAFGPGVGLLAGLFLAVDLTSAAYSLTLLTEPLFTVLLLLCALGLARYVGQGGGSPVARAALWCGIAILVRPISVFLPLVLGPALGLLRQPGVAGRVRLVGGCLFVLVTLTFPVGWSIRNYSVAGTAQLTSLVAINAYYHRAAAIEAERRGVPVEDVRRELVERGVSADGPRPSEAPSDLAAMERAALDAVMADPGGYLVSHLRGVAHLLAPDGDVVAQLRVGGEQATGPPGSVAEFVDPGSGRYDEDPYDVPILGTLQLLVLYPLAVVGVVAGVGRPAERRVTILLLTFVLYFLLVSGPEAYPRFRVPVMPFVALLAALGARTLGGYVASRRADLR
jgi:4-amino-4-deoxy-L-arabinose transferase-like glycosyltransferase